MIGKKNIVFGFFYLVLTASLGPFMILKYYDDVATSEAAKQQKIGALQQARDSGYEVDLEKMNAEQIAKASTDALLALSARLNSRTPIDEIKGGAALARQPRGGVEYSGRDRVVFSGGTGGVQTSHQLAVHSRHTRPFRIALPGGCGATALGRRVARQLDRLHRPESDFSRPAADRYRGGDGF